MVRGSIPSSEQQSHSLHLTGLTLPFYTSPYTDSNQPPLFRLLAIVDFERDNNQDAFDKPAFLQSYGLLLVSSGSGTLVADNKSCLLEPHKAFLLQPGTLVEINWVSEPCCLFVLFEALYEQSRTEEARTFGICDNAFAQHSVELPKNCFHELYHLASSLDRSRHGMPEARGHRNQLTFYKLVYLLLDFNQEQEEHDSREGIMRSIRVMEQRYAENLPRNELAAIAGMSPWHYSHLFKVVTGESPHRYLSALRIREAKNLLRKGVNLHQAAIQVGYSDDSHFRRMFKAHTGMSPSVFVQQINARIAAVSYHYAAHLLSLGIIPYVAPVDRDREQHRRPFHDQIQVHLQRQRKLPDKLWLRNMQSVAEAKPELIICDEIVPSEWQHQLEKIAPTIIIPWMKDDWRGHFMTIGAIVGKEELVRQWITAYDRKAQKTSQRIKERLGNETVTLLHLIQGELVVYGKRNGGAVLYDDLGLAAPFNKDEIAVIKVLDEAELPGFSGDHLLLVLDQDEASLSRWESLKHGELWACLTAVRKQQVHLISETPWLEYSPLAHELILDEAVNLFLKTD